ncbi:MAG TPA: glycine zipper family protein [Chitinophagaceae bacterium]
MKRLLLLTCLAILCSQAIFSQDTLLRKNYIVKTKLLKINDSVYNVYLADINDTALLLSRTPVSFRSYISENPYSVNFDQIRDVTLSRKGNAGRGILIGVITGAVVGGIIGAITYQGCDNCFLDFGIGFDITIGAFLGSIGGGLTGLIIGSSKKRQFSVGGGRDNFNRMRLSVLDMTYRKVRN